MFRKVRQSEEITEEDKKEIEEKRTCPFKHRKLAYDFNCKKECALHLNDYLEGGGCAFRIIAEEIRNEIFYNRHGKHWDD